ncbi:hypothetical protein [Rummeliibacillus sp. POC4]|uniref:hypothetical protein n=1 Tax=Rummeliibacillus sp. POC4 TaxID=2305899 RepID=UPI000E6672E7|nr:hypothetical protein [Rummeliibacillus sp. POC4]RIJ63789.1 hypothetical protein D1606_13315 [Rummeliibacillus sp. POC4]
MTKLKKSEFKKEMTFEEELEILFCDPNELEVEDSTFIDCEFTKYLNRLDYYESIWECESEEFKRFYVLEQEKIENQESEILTSIENKSELLFEYKHNKNQVLVRLNSFNEWLDNFLQSVIELMNSYAKGHTKLYKEQYKQSEQLYNELLSFRNIEFDFMPLEMLIK